jgi:AcrR family transcriptional regulator
MTEMPSGGAPAQQRALRAQGKRTMRKLMNAGMKVFDERGYQAARVDDVVKAAKTSHGTFYLYFANKEDLFRVLAEDVVGAMTALADQLGPVTTDKAGYVQLRDWLRAFVDTYRQYGPVIRVWAEAQLENKELSRVGMTSMDALTSTIATRVRETCKDPSVDPENAAVALVAMVERLNYYVLSRRLSLADDDMLDALARIAHAGMFGGTLNGVHA